MTDPIRLIARPLLASQFLAGGARALVDPDGAAPAADEVVDAVGDRVGAVEKLETSEAVRANALAQLVGGVLLALGRAPRTSAALLAASLVPSTLAAHRFWEESDVAARQEQQAHFLKNVALLGGLGIAAMDTEGRASLPRRTRRAVKRAKVRGELATADARRDAELRAQELRHQAEMAVGRRRRKVEKQAVRASKAAEHARDRVELAGRRLVPDVVDLAEAATGLVTGSRDDDGQDRAA